MFTSVYDQIESSALAFIIILLVALFIGVLSSFALSFVLKSSKKFFVTNAILTVIIAVAISLVNGNTGSALAVAAVGLGLLRFRSAPGTSEEIGALFISVVTGIALGTGYIAYAVIFAVIINLLFVVLSKTNLFHHKIQDSEKEVKITIPEDLNYEVVFENTFKHFTKEYEYVKVKTSDMGSLYKLSVRVVMKDPKEVKTMLDEIRQMNGNMEVSVTPYVYTTQNL